MEAKVMVAAPLAFSSGPRPGYALRRAANAIATAIDRLVPPLPPRDRDRAPVPPPEWFRYPPF